MVAISPLIARIKLESASSELLNVHFKMSLEMFDSCWRAYGKRDKLQQKQMFGKSTISQSSVSFSQWKVEQMAMFEQKSKEFSFSLRAAELKN